MPVSPLALLCCAVGVTVAVVAANVAHEFHRRRVARRWNLHAMKKYETDCARAALYNLPQPPPPNRWVI